MEIASTTHPHAVVVRVNGRIDAATAPEFERACLAGASAGNLILDLTGVHYISSAGLRGVLSAGKAVNARSGKLHLVGLGGVVRQVFELSGLVGLFPEHPTQEAAIAATA